MPSVTTVEDFLATVRKSGVVEDDALEAEVEELRAGGLLPEEPRALAVLLIRSGLLTTFQARFLLHGKWRNLLLSGKYRLLDMVGAGGMGNVYVAEHVLLRRKVALKVLPTPLTERPASVQRFYREARAVASLDHPNIVRAYDVDKEGHLHFLVLEYVEGVSLQELVRQRGRLEPARAGNYVCQVAAGLAHAHQAGWVHRDIKPGNLLIDRHGTIKILDLGLARMFEGSDELTKEHDGKAVLGTADYLAPEQALRADVDIRADIYSLGCTFYFLLAGHPPFPFGNTAQKLMAHQSKKPQPISEVRPDVPADLQRVLERMMEKAPERRYQSPSEVLDVLLPWAQNSAANSAVSFVLDGATGPVGSLSGFTTKLSLPGGGPPTPGSSVSSQLATRSVARSDDSTAGPDEPEEEESPPRRRPLLAALLGAVRAFLS